MFATDRWGPQVNALFEDRAPDWLAFAASALAALLQPMSAVGLPMLSNGEARPYSAHAGAIIARYRSLIVIVIVMVAFAKTYRVASPVPVTVTA